MGDGRWGGHVGSAGQRIPQFEQMFWMIIEHPFAVKCLRWNSNAGQGGPETKEKAPPETGGASSVCVADDQAVFSVQLEQ